VSALRCGRDRTDSYAPSTEHHKSGNPYTGHCAALHNCSAGSIEIRGCGVLLASGDGVGHTSSTSFWPPPHCEIGSWWARQIRTRPGPRTATTGRSRPPSWC